VSAGRGGSLCSYTLWLALEQVPVLVCRGMKKVVHNRLVSGNPGNAPAGTKTHSVTKSFLVHRTLGWKA